MESKWTAGAILLGCAMIAIAIVLGACIVAQGLSPNLGGGGPLSGRIVFGRGGQGQPVPPSGKWANANTPMQVGDRVLAPDGGQWWEAEILAVHKDGSVQIRYIGWGPQFDRLFMKDELQLK